MKLIPEKRGKSTSINVGTEGYVDHGKGLNQEAFNFFVENHNLHLLQGEIEDIKNLCKPETDEGLILMPKELTAENGAKGLLSGEFFQIELVDCPDCDLKCKSDCTTCNDTGSINVRVDIGWTTIKEIYAMAVKHLNNTPKGGVGMECEQCEDCKLVCEDHTDKPWGEVSDSENACHCGGAGSPCSSCCPNTAKPAQRIEEQ